MSTSSFPVVVYAIKVLTDRSQRVGRTHIHKYLFLAESWGLLPAAHRFSLYLHGPYSRELDGELLALRAGGMVQADPDPAGYGARFTVADMYVGMAADQLQLDAGSTLNLGKIANVIAPMSVRELEAVSTSEYVRRSSPGAPDEAVCRAVMSLKPHLPRDEVDAAILKLGSLREAVGGS
jgi:uncharacterized protein YwgA